MEAPFLCAGRPFLYVEESNPSDRSYSPLRCFRRPLDCARRPVDGAAVLMGCFPCIKTFFEIFSNFVCWFRKKFIYLQPKLKATTIMAQKVKVSSDTLYQYLKEHNFIISLLGKRMGVSNGIVCNSFQHVLNRLGKPMNFSAANLERLNMVLPQIADELRAATITFGSDQTFANSWGRIYDPGTLQAFHHIGQYFKMEGFVERVLGWNKVKRYNVLSVKSSRVYGNIAQDDVNRINMELLSVAGVLSSYEVVPDETDTENPDRQDNKPVKTKKVRTRMEDAFAAAPHPWDNTALPLLDRYELFHREYPEGVLFFRVNSGYTVAQDDSRRLCELCSSLAPYTHSSDGLTTTYMDSDLFASVMPHCVGIGYRIAVTDMYAE